MMKIGTKVIKSGYPGTVTRICEWDTDLIEIRMEGGGCCMDKADFDGRYPNTYIVGEDTRCQKHGTPLVERQTLRGVRNLCAECAEERLKSPGILKDKSRRRGEEDPTSWPDNVPV